MLLLLGILPIEGHLDKQVLGFFGHIARHQDTLEFRVISRQLAIQDLNSTSWAAHIRKLLSKYSLPTAFELITSSPQISLESSGEEEGQLSVVCKTPGNSMFAVIPPLHKPARLTNRVPAPCMVVCKQHHHGCPPRLHKGQATDGEVPPTNYGVQVLG